MPLVQRYENPWCRSKSHWKINGFGAYVGITVIQQLPSPTDLQSTGQLKKVAMVLKQIAVLPSTNCAGANSTAADPQT